MTRVEPMPGFHVFKSPVLEAFMAKTPLTVHHMGRTIGNQEWGRYSSKVYYHRLYFFLSGKATVFWGRQSRALLPGHAYFFPSGRYYKFHTPDTFDKLYLSVTLNFAPPGLAPIDPMAGTLPPKPLPFAKVGFSQTWISRFEKPNLADGLALQATCLKAISLWLPPETAGDFHARSRAHQTWEPLHALIAGAPGRLPSVGACAREMGLTPSALNRKFKADHGSTLKIFLEREMIRRARSELLATPDKIKTIAERLGFNYESYFSRFFRKHTGQSPEAFRRSPGR